MAEPRIFENAAGAAADADARDQIRMMSFAPTPVSSVPSTRTSKVFERVCSRHWVASTCSTWLVPMPKAKRAESAMRGGMAIAANHRHAGLSQALLRADDMNDALLRAMRAEKAGCRNRGSSFRTE